MTLEERIVNEIRHEQHLVPPGRPGPMPHDRPIWRRSIAIAALLAVLVGAGLTLNRWTAGPDQVANSLERGEILIDGEVSLPVSGHWGTIDVRGRSLDVLTGAAGPAPDLELELAGEEQPFVSATPDWDPSIWAGDVPLVYMGDVNERPVFVHTNGTIGVFDRLSAALSGDQLGEHICMTVGSYDDPAGGVGFCGSGTATAGPFIKNGVGPLGIGWATWIDLPEGTSVVTASIDGEISLWQRAAGETAFFDFGEIPEGQVTLTAISPNGEVLGAETFPPERFSR